MAFLHDDVLDNGLSVLTDDGNRLDICTQEPTTFAEATSTHTVGNKTSYNVGSPESRSPDGRKVVADAVTDGSVTGTDTATHWAITDTVNDKLLAANSLDSSQAVTSGNTFTLPAFDIGIPAP